MKFLFTILGASLLILASARASELGIASPNIILIMSDDVGYSDIGCYGGEIETPNLDALANNGIRFTQFYNTARCCPTRASLMTGLYAHQASIGHMVDGANTKAGGAYAGELSKSAVTIAEVLNPANYATYMVGKWHVTKMTKPRNDGDRHNWPKQRGFDRFYGTIHGAGSFFDPNTLVRDNSFVSPFADSENKREGTHVNAGELVPLILRGVVDLPLRTWFNLGVNVVMQGSLKFFLGGTCYGPTRTR